MSYNVPEELKYTKDHEWTNLSDGAATVGITDFAQSSLGDIVFVELPEAGSTITKGESFGVVESIKSVSDLYSPLSGEVIEANSELESQPDLLNESPYSNWLIKIKLSNESETSELLPSTEYVKLQTEE
jgi:glycine cleavage system H protein